MGIAVRAARPIVAASLAVVLLVLAVGAASGDASRRFVLIVSGADGGAESAANHVRWREALVYSLVDRMRVPREHITVLHDAADAATRSLATREHVRDAVEGLASAVGARDVVLVVLLGHGTFDGVDAKFNLVGPDLEAGEWRALLEPIRGTVVVVNTTGASFPFLQRLTGPRRVVVTATSSAAQRFDTVFGEFFSQAFGDDASDLDKNGRISIGEAFTFAATRATRWYEQRGTLATERAALDDNGDGVGQPAGELGPDGAVASRLFLDPDPDESRSTDPAVSELVARRDAIERQIDEVRRKKGFMPPADYERELERLLIELARLSQRLRNRG